MRSMVIGMSMNVSWMRPRVTIEWRGVGVEDRLHWVAGRVSWWHGIVHWYGLNRWHDLEVNIQVKSMREQVTAIENFLA